MVSRPGHNFVNNRGQSTLLFQELGGVVVVAARMVHPRAVCRQRVDVTNIRRVVGIVHVDTPSSGLVSLEVGVNPRFELATDGGGNELVAEPKWKPGPHAFDIKVDLCMPCTHTHPHKRARRIALIAMVEHATVVCEQPAATSCNKPIEAGSSVERRPQCGTYAQGG